jgi:predicted transcriptional regulator
MEERKKKKALPFEWEQGFTGLPNNMFKIYRYHPEYSSFVHDVYLYLLERFNSEFGYAFPTQDEIAYSLHMSDRTVKKAIKTLRKLELIRAEPSPIIGASNNVYYFNKPVESLEELEQKFPEVKEYREKYEAKWAAKFEKRKAEKQKWYEKKKKKPDESNDKSPRNTSQTVDDDFEDFLNHL